MVAGLVSGIGVTRGKTLSSICASEGPGEIIFSCATDETVLADMAARGAPGDGLNALSGALAWTADAFRVLGRVGPALEVVVLARFSNLATVFFSEPKI